ncbi:hypothetical protein [Alkalihalobacillus deserti]|uniref:hypothetical protein n=1 Tax=Alkalihalobacillus deserti TaxID=2879466 RepID=UPI001D145BF8|nr:hypothetical protein [Alkalihalobacillus deserti]
MMEASSPSIWFQFYSVIGILTTLLPLILAIIITRWLFILKRNSNEQMKQNEEIITLLKEINNSHKE